MRGRDDGDHVFGQVDADRQALLVNIREMAHHLFGVLVRDVEVNELLARDLELVVDAAGYHVARSERSHRVVLLHELLAVLQSQQASEAPHRLGDQERRALAGIVERGGVELDELHVLDHALGPVHHRHAVARGYGRVGRRVVDIAHAAGRHDGHFGQHGVYFVFLEVQHVGSEAGDVGRALFDEPAQVVLREDVDGEMVLVDVDVVVAFDAFHQGALDLVTGQVVVVQDAVLAVPALAVQIVPSRRVLVELGPPLDQLFDDRRGARDDLLDGRRVADAGPADHRVADVFLERVGLVHDRGDAALRIVGVALAQLALGDDRDPAVFGRFQRKAQSGDAAADNQKIRFDVHMPL